MPSGCCVNGCKNRTYKANKPRVRRHAFPKTKERYDLWINACTSKAKLDAKNLKICYLHFTEDDYTLQSKLQEPFEDWRLNENAIPSVFVVNSAKQSTTSSSPQITVGENLGLPKKFEEENIKDSAQAISIIDEKLKTLKAYSKNLQRQKTFDPMLIIMYKDFNDALKFFEEKFDEKRKTVFTGNLKDKPIDYKLLYDVDSLVDKMVGLFKLSNVNTGNNTASVAAGNAPMDYTEKKRSTVEIVGIGDCFLAVQAKNLEYFEEMDGIITDAMDGCSENWWVLERKRILDKQCLSIVENREIELNKENEVSESEKTIATSNKSINKCKRRVVGIWHCFMLIKKFYGLFLSIVILDREINRLVSNIKKNDGMVFTEEFYTRRYSYWVENIKNFKKWFDENKQNLIQPRRIKEEEKTNAANDEPKDNRPCHKCLFEHQSIFVSILLSDYALTILHEYVKKLETYLYLYTGKCAFTAEELKQVFEPVLNKLLDVENPKNTDLPNIKSILESGYCSPRKVVEDVWLVLDNINKKKKRNSKNYEHGEEMSKIFEGEVDGLMQKLGFCCGRKYTYEPRVLRCYGKEHCLIPVNSKYYSSKNKAPFPYTLCQKCFGIEKRKPEGITIMDENGLKSKIKKEDFEEMTNNHKEPEAFVDCLNCGRKQHQICVLYSAETYPNGFTCDFCLKEMNKKREENKYNAKNLPNTDLGDYIETRVNNYLEKNKADAGQVHIRVVSNLEKTVAVKPRMKKRFVEKGKMAGEFQYQSKALLAFQEIDGVDVCFFAMFVQEYGSECASPNTRQVYLAYLDSVQFFIPREQRKAVYQEILLGYMEYVKQSGYLKIHIWACPPGEGDDYIFNRHPPDQKILTPKHLQQWYITLFERGIMEGIIHDFKDILQQSKEDNLTSVTEIPYFKGDYWPDKLENTIKKIDQKEERKRKHAEAVNARGSKRFKGSELPQTKDNNEIYDQVLTKQIFSTMEETKDSFFTIQLNPEASTSKIQDPNPLMMSKLMDERDTFLNMARDNHWEFSSPRRARFSTLVLEHKLHSESKEILNKLVNGVEELI